MTNNCVQRRVSKRSSYCTRLAVMGIILLHRRSDTAYVSDIVQYMVDMHPEDKFS